VLRTIRRVRPSSFSIEDASSSTDRTNERTNERTRDRWCDAREIRFARTRDDDVDDDDDDDDRRA